MEESASSFNRLKSSQRQSGGYVDKIDSNKHQFNKKAKQQVEATKAHCANKVATVKADSFRSDRSHNKTTMALEGDLEALKSATTNSHGLLVEYFNDRL